MREKSSVNLLPEEEGSEPRELTEEELEQVVGGRDPALFEMWRREYLVKYYKEKLKKYYK